MTNSLSDPRVKAILLVGFVICAFIGASLLLLLYGGYQTSHAVPSTAILGCGHLWGRTIALFNYENGTSSVQLWNGTSSESTRAGNYQVSWKLANGLYDVRVCG